MTIKYNKEEIERTIKSANNLIRLVQESIDVLSDVSSYTHERVMQEHAFIRRAKLGINSFMDIYELGVAFGHTLAIDEITTDQEALIRMRGKPIYPVFEGGINPSNDYRLNILQKILNEIRKELQEDEE